MREQERFRPKIYEDEAIVLDVVPPRWGHRPGHHGQFNRAYLLGTEHFTLLEAAVSSEINLIPGNVLYIGKDVPRDLVKIVGASVTRSCLRQRRWSWRGSSRGS